MHLCSGDELMGNEAITMEAGFDLQQELGQVLSNGVIESLNDT